ncbi:hypothetical protein [Streptomyces sp. 2231.1]|uniref:hypothetical protein n=1 Tax=Streptomyces sp. 2231.1 TaxID=1855347 RepID=UPI000B0806D5|nr:hypothetical protein [Streptomyces sp. 2231.1]
MTCAGGTSFTESYRLVTTLTDASRYPATALVSLYHQRWEHESAYYALRHTIMHGRNLCSGDPAGIEQEMWSLLTLYQALRTVMVGADPDRCCFSITLHTARDQVIQATGIVTTDTDRDTLLGTIGRRILTGLLPPRRQRASTRKATSPMSRYSERREDGRPDTSRTVTHLNVTVPEPMDHSPALPSASRDDRHAAPAARRRHRILAPLQEAPRVFGSPVTSPPTSAMSLWRPCTDN